MRFLYPSAYRWRGGCRFVSFFTGQKSHVCYLPLDLVSACEVRFLDNCLKSPILTFNAFEVLFVSEFRLGALRASYERLRARFRQVRQLSKCSSRWRVSRSVAALWSLQDRKLERERVPSGPGGLSHPLGSDVRPAARTTPSHRPEFDHLKIPVLTHPD